MLCEEGIEYMEKYHNQRAKVEAARKSVEFWLASCEKRIKQFESESFAQEDAYTFSRGYFMGLGDAMHYLKDIEKDLI